MAYTDLSSGFGSGTTIPSSVIQVLQDNYKSFVNQESGAPILDVIRTGTYVGNGSTSNYISGIGFMPAYVFICKNILTVGYNINSDYINYQKQNDGTVKSIYNDFYITSNSIINIGSDGFTVSDSGNNSDPNGNGINYQYTCWKQT